MVITDLITDAQQMGIIVYPRDGQIQVDIPWPVDRIPDPAMATLGALRERKPEVLAHFALLSPKLDIKLMIAALEAQGVKITPDPINGFNFYVSPTTKRNKDVAVKLLARLNNHKAISELVHQLAQQAPEG